MIPHGLLEWLNSGLGTLGFFFAFAGTNAVIKKKLHDALVMFGLVALSFFLVLLLN